MAAAAPPALVIRKYAISLSSSPGITAALPCVATRTSSQLRRYGMRVVKFVILGVLATGLVATAALGLVSRDPACCDSRAMHVPYEWSAYNRLLDEAIAAGDGTGAVRAWRDVWATAIASRRWDLLVAAGDQALRAGELTPGMGTARADARRAYHAALFRAYGQSSADGVLRAADAMASMGDAELVDGALQLARRLAASTRNGEHRDWIEHEVVRIALRATTVVSASPRTDIQAPAMTQ
jgi:hypothetical protein